MTRSAVILDFDGVLADSAQVYVELYRDLAAREGKASPVRTVAEWREWYQPRWERNFAALGIPAQRLPDMVAWCFGRLRYDRVGLFPGVPALLDDLGRDCSLAIASSTRASLIEGMLEREGLRDRFALVLGGTTRGSDKSEMVGDAVRALGAGPGRTVMVGDTTADLDAARACGLPAVGVTYGWMAPDRLAAAGPEALAGSPAEIPAAVRALLARRFDVSSPRPRG